MMTVKMMMMIIIIIYEEYVCGSFMLLIDANLPSSFFV